MKALERATVIGADAGFGHNQHSDASYNDAYQYVKFDTSNYEIMKVGYAIQVQIEIKTIMTKEVKSISLLILNSRDTNTSNVEVVMVTHIDLWVSVVERL